MNWSDATFGYDSSGAFNSVANSLSKNPIAKGGGMAFPFLAAAALGSSVLGGLFGGRAEEENRRVSAQIAKMQAEGAMQGAFRGAQTKQWGDIAAPEYAYELDKRARNYENLFFKPQEIYTGSEERRRQLRDIYSPEGRFTSSLSRSNDIARTAAERQALTNAMFGTPAFNPIAYTNAPWMSAP